MKIKKKTKDKPLSPKEQAQSIMLTQNKRDADAKGMSLKEFIKARDIEIASRKNYGKTHWVQPLSYAQKMLIVCNTKKPHTYMSLPLSKGNAELIELFKKENYSKIIKAQAINIETGFNTVGEAREFYDTYAQQQFYHDKLVKRKAELIEIRDKELNKRKMLTDKLTNILEVRLKKNISPILETLGSIKTTTKPLRDAQEIIRKEYEEIGRKLKISGGIMNAPQLTPTIHTGYLLHKAEKEKKLTAMNGLNSYMKRNGIKKPYDIGKHYMDTHKDKEKVDYVVDSYDNPIALAQGAGMLPKRVFELICIELKKSKKSYEKLDFEKRGYSIEELINLYDNKKAEKKNFKYNQKYFFSSKDRIAWSEKYNYHWDNYTRFMDDFPTWIKVFKAEAKKREENDADMFTRLIASENARVK